jgi:ribosome-associated protein
VVRKPSRLDSRQLAHRAARFALEKKGREPVVMDLRELSFLCDYYVIVDGDSEPQVKAIADRIERGLKEAGETAWHVEGTAGRQWILMDYVDVVIHVFLKSARELYLLEKLWGDAPREVIDDAGVESP